MVSFKTILFMDTIFKKFTIHNGSDGTIRETCKDMESLNKRLNEYHHKDILPNNEYVFSCLNHGDKIFDRGIDTGLCIGDKVRDAEGGIGFIMAQYEVNDSEVRCTANGITSLSDLVKV